MIYEKYEDQIVNAGNLIKKNNTKDAISLLLETQTSIASKMREYEDETKLDKNAEVDPILAQGYYLIALCSSNLVGIKAQVLQETSSKKDHPDIKVLLDIYKNIIKYKKTMNLNIEAARERMDVVNEYKELKQTCRNIELGIKDIEESFKNTYTIVKDILAEVYWNTAVGFAKAIDEKKYSSFDELNNLKEKADFNYKKAKEHYGNESYKKNCDINIALLNEAVADIYYDMVEEHKDNADDLTKVLDGCVEHNLKASEIFVSHGEYAKYFMQIQSFYESSLIFIKEHLSDDRLLDKAKLQIQKCFDLSNKMEFEKIAECSPELYLNYIETLAEIYSIQEENFKELSNKVLQSKFVKCSSTFIDSIETKIPDGNMELISNSVANVKGFLATFSGIDYDLIVNEEKKKEKNEMVIEVRVDDDAIIAGPQPIIFSGKKAKPKIKVQTSTREDLNNATVVSPNPVEFDLLFREIAGKNGKKRKAGDDQKQVQMYGNELGLGSTESDSDSESGFPNKKRKI